MDVRTYAAVLVRHWIVLVAAVLVGLAVGGAAVLLSTPQYSSTARVVFSPTGVETGQDLAYAGNYVQGRMQTYKGLASSPVVLEPVIDELGLDTTPADLAGQLSVAGSQIDTLLSIEAADEDARRAASIADAVAEQLLVEVADLEGPQSGNAGVAGHVVGPAVVATDPATPRVALDLAAGALLGAFLGLLGVSARHLLRDEA